ncbi:MAG: phospholipase D-like domain-containing protein [Limisphaerales bacterium]
MTPRLPALITAALLSLSAPRTWSTSEPCFVPGGNCEQRILNEINNAHTSLQIQAYVFTDQKILDAVVAAKNRNVAVQIIIDRNWKRQSPAAVEFLRANSVSVMVDSAHPIAHNKIIIVDLARVLTGSYNFTISAARYNGENSVLITNEPNTTAAYELNFRAHLLHSLPP